MTTITTTARRKATQRDIDRAQATDGKPLRLRCGDGLYCVVTPAGTRTFKCDYWRGKKHYREVLGHAPAMSLVQAKAARMALRETTLAGRDPRAERREQHVRRQSADAATVRAIGDEWVKVTSGAASWRPGTRHDVELRLANHIYPVLGDLPVSRVSTQQVQSLLWDVAKRFRSQAVHVRQNLAGLFDYAIEHDHVAVNPVRKIAKRLPRRVIGDEAERPHAHVSKIEDARAVLRAVEAGNATPFVVLAHRLIALTAVRKMEGLEARWSEVDLDAGVWIIAASRMKGRHGKRRPHVVALAPQAVEVFRAAKQFADQLDIRSEFVFPSLMYRTRAVAENSLNSALKIALRGSGLRHVVHGWRSTFTIVMSKRDRRDREVLDLMLAHKPIGPSLAARHYDGSMDDPDLEIDPDRLRLACAWADTLMVGAPSAFALIGHEPVPASNVVNLRRVA